MNSTHDIINKRNYVRREIKEIKGNQNINLENLEIIEDLTKIHEIKVLNQKLHPEEKNETCKRKIFETNITLEGEPIEKHEEQNNFEPINKNESSCPDSYNKEMNEEVFCDECRKNINSEENDQIQIGYVNAPFLKRNEEEEDIIETEHINNLIEHIFGQLGNDDILNNYNSIKISFQELNGNEKDEVIEGIKIKIENEEQENRFNNLIKLLY